MKKCEHGFETGGADYGCSAACPYAVGRSYNDDLISQTMRTLRDSALRYITAVINGLDTSEVEFEYNVARNIAEATVQGMGEDIVRLAREKMNGNV